MGDIYRRTKDFCPVFLAYVVDGLRDLAYMPQDIYYKMKLRLAKNEFQKLMIKLRQRRLITKRLQQLDAFLNTVEAYRKKYGLPVYERPSIEEVKKVQDGSKQTL